MGEDSSCKGNPYDSVSSSAIHAWLNQLNLVIPYIPIATLDEELHQIILATARGGLLKDDR